MLSPTDRGYARIRLRPVDFRLDEGLPDNLLVAPKTRAKVKRLLYGVQSGKNAQGLGTSDCKHPIPRGRRNSKTANRSTAICRWALRSILGY